MSTLNWGEDAAAVNEIAGHNSEGTCTACGGNHSWDQVVNAAVAALDRKIAELHAARSPAPGVVPFPTATTSASNVTYSWATTQVPAEQNAPAEPEPVAEPVTYTSAAGFISGTHATPVIYTVKPEQPEQPEGL